MSSKLSVTVSAPKRFDVVRLALMGAAELQRQSSDHLRRYASPIGVKGASHLAGGKQQLLRAILEARIRLVAERREGK